MQLHFHYCLLLMYIYGLVIAGHFSNAGNLSWHRRLWGTLLLFTTSTPVSGQIGPVLGF
jgi:hypothetical protein